MINFKRLALTDLKVDIPRLAKKKVLKEALEASGACQPHKGTAADTRLYTGQTVGPGGGERFGAVLGLVDGQLSSGNVFTAASRTRCSVLRSSLLPCRKTPVLTVNEVLYQSA